MDPPLLFDLCSAEQKTSSVSETGGPLTVPPNGDVVSSVPEAVGEWSVVILHRYVTHTIRAEGTVPSRLGDGTLEQNAGMEQST